MDNKKRKVMCRKFRDAFFNELINFLEHLSIIVPDEAVNIIVYLSMVRKANSISSQEWVLDTFRYHVVDRFYDQIMNKEAKFFVDNGNDILDEHAGEQYGSDAIEWFEKLKLLWQEGKIEKSQEEWTWNFMQTFAQLATKEYELRDK